MLFRAAVQSYLLECSARGLSDKTQWRYRYDLGLLARSSGACELSALSAGPVRAWLSQMQLAKLSAYSIEGRYRSAHAFFAFCVREGWLECSPMDRVGKPKLPKRIVSRLNDEEMVLLIGEVAKTKARTRNLALVSLMLDSGLRLGETIGLELSCVDLARRQARVIGKGDKERVVPLSPLTAQLLAAWLAERPRSCSERVFVNREGELLTLAAVGSLMRRLRKRLGWKRLYAHLLRHSFAKNSLKRHGNVKVLQQTLGHSRASTTLDFYVSFDDDELIEIHDRGSPLMAIRDRLTLLRETK